MGQDDISEEHPFSPESPDNMPEALISAAQQVYQQRDIETQGTWSRPTFKRASANISHYDSELDDGDQEARIPPKVTDDKLADNLESKKLLIPTEEEILYKICESKEVANASTKLEIIVSPPSEFWESLLFIGISFREQIRTTDKRTKKERVEVLEKIREQLEQTARLVSEEISGRYSDGLLSGELDHPLEPFGHMLLSGISTFPFSIVGEKEQGKPRKNETIRFRGRLSPRCVSTANTALSKRIKILISEIKRSGNISERRSPDKKRRDAKIVRKAWRHCYFEMREIFEKQYPDELFKKQHPDKSKQNFTIARSKTIFAFAISVLGDDDAVNLPAQFKEIADEWRRLH